MKVLVVDYSAIRESAVRDARIEREQWNRNKLDRATVDGGYTDSIGYRNGPWLSVKRSLDETEALDVLRHGR